MATKSVQLAIPGFPNALRVTYEQTRGASGYAKIYQLEGQKDNRITLHADGVLHKHGIFSQLSDDQALRVINGYDNA